MPPVADTRVAGVALIDDSAQVGRTRSAGLNAVSYLLDFTARSVVMLLITPILLEGLGKSLFGAWQVILKVVGYVAAADGRPTQGFQWIVAGEADNPDHTRKRSAIGDAIGVALVFLPVLAIVGSIAIYFAPILSGAPTEHHGVVRLATSLLVLNLMLVVLAFLPEAALEGMNLRYRRMMLRTGITVGAGIASAVVVSLGYGLTALAAVTIGQTLATAFLAWTVAKTLFPWFGFVRPTWKGTRAFLGLSTQYLGATVLSKLMRTSDVVVLGIVASASLVTDYTVTSYAATVLIYTIPAVLNSAVPGMASLVQSRLSDRVMALRNEMLAIGWLIMTILGTVILLWNRSFVALWVGEEHYAGTIPSLLIVLLVAQLIFIESDSAILDSTLDLSAKLRAGFAASALTILLSTLLIPKLGINGLCIGFILGRSLLSIGYPIAIRKNLALPGSMDILSLLRPGSVMLLMFLGASFLGQVLLVTTPPFWVGAVLITVAAVSPLAFYTGLSRSMRGNVSKRVRRLARR